MSVDETLSTLSRLEALREANRGLPAEDTAQEWIDMLMRNPAEYATYHLLLGGLIKEVISFEEGEKDG